MIKQWISGILGTLFIFLSPTYLVFISITIMVMFDFISAVIACWYNNEDITSKRMRTTIGKLAAYWILILMAHIMDIIFITPFLGNTIFFKSVAFFIGSIEFTSIIENSNRVLQIKNLKETIISFLSQNRK